MRLVVVTNRLQAGPTFLSRMEAIATTGPDAIMLREKDMEKGDFDILAELVGMSCDFHDVPLVVNSFTDTAVERNLRLHLPLEVLRRDHDRVRNLRYGASIHSLEDLKEAESLGAQWVVFGNVFETTCKPGKAAEGVDMLRRICDASSVPVYAIGGVTPANVSLCRDAGAEGVCVMSPFMLAEDPSDLMDRFRLALQ